ncbi:MAG: hypothetical protein ACREQT_17665 [Candidatus Binataceae bacterium]
MGATQTQTLTRVVLPTAVPGTAPLLFTALFSEFWISRTVPHLLPKKDG